MSIISENILAFHKTDLYCKGKYFSYYLEVSLSLIAIISDYVYNRLYDGQIYSQQEMMYEMLEISEIIQCSSLMQLLWPMGSYHRGQEVGVIPHSAESWGSQRTASAWCLVTCTLGIAHKSSSVSLHSPDLGKSL